MQDDSNETNDSWDVPEGQGHVRTIPDTDRDDVVDPVETTVFQKEDREMKTTGPAEPEVEVQPPASSTVGSSVQLAQPKRTWISRFMPSTRRELQIQALQAGYTEMLDTMRSISTHLEQQSNVQDNILGALEQFPEAMESLRDVGKATEQQTVMMGLVKQRLETNASHEQQVADSMNRFNNTLTMMDETSKTTSETIGTMVDRSRESEESLRNMMERSERRATKLLGVLGFLTIGIVGAALYFGVRGRSVEPTTTWMPAKGGSGQVQQERGGVKPDSARVALPAQSDPKDKSKAAQERAEPRKKVLVIPTNSDHKEPDKVKKVDPSVASAPKTKGFTAREARPVGDKKRDAGKVIAPALGNDVANLDAKPKHVESKNVAKKTVKSSDETSEANEDSSWSESIIKKVVTALSGSEETESVPDGQKEPPK